MLAFAEGLLYVAAMLHDIGLVGAFDNATVSFDEAGGNIAWMFAAGAGWPGWSARPGSGASESTRRVPPATAD